MAASGEGYYDQGRSTTRPPLFKGTNFSYWKNCMQMFIKIEDYKLWNIITKGPYVPMRTIDEKTVKKTEEQYTQEDFIRLSKNCKAMHANQYNRIVHMNQLKISRTSWS